MPSNLKPESTKNRVRGICLFSSGFISAIIIWIAIVFTGVSLIDKEKTHPPAPADFNFDLLYSLNNNYEKLVIAFKNFYTSLEEEQWEESYQYRNETFRNSMPKQEYINQMSYYVSDLDWKLMRLEVLSIHIVIPNTKVQFVVRYDEGEKWPISYGISTWEKISNEWYCVESGLEQILVF